MRLHATVRQPLHALPPSLNGLTIRLSARIWTARSRRGIARQSGCMDTQRTKWSGGRAPRFCETIRDRYEDPKSPYGIAAVVRTGTPAFVANISDEMIVSAADGDQERIRLVRALAPRSYICVPLVARGRTLGALSFATAESGRH